MPPPIIIRPRVPSVPVTARVRTRPEASTVVKKVAGLPVRPLTVSTGNHNNLNTAARKERFLQCLEDEDGVITHAAKKAGVERTTIYLWIRDDPNFAAAVREMDEIRLDMAEAQLNKNIREGKEASLIFFLKTRGRKRGYVEFTRMEHTGADGGPITLMQAEQVRDELPLDALQAILAQTFFKGCTIQLPAGEPMKQLNAPPVA